MSSLPTNSDEDLQNPISFFPGVRLQAPFNTDIPPTYAEDALWGMGIRHLLPARFVFPPWPGMIPGDEFLLYVNDMNSSIASAVVVDVKAEALLKVDQMPSGEVLIRGRVRRANSLQNSYSTIEKVLVIPNHPAGFDQDVAKPWHSGLSLSIEDMPRGSIIDASIAKLGLWCLINKHLYARKNDVLIIYCGGFPTEYVLSEEDAEGPGPYRVFITPQVLAKVIDNGEIEVIYTVRNAVGNSPGGEHQFSESYRLISEKEPGLLAFPYFLKDGEPSDYIDLSTDSQLSLAMEVTPTRVSPIPKPLNQITGILTLVLDGQSTVIRLPPVTDSGRGSTLTIPLSYDLFTSLANGLFRLSFESHTPVGVVLGTSGSALVKVRGLPVSMPAVTIDQLLAGLIASDKEAVVTIPKYRPHNPDWLETFWIEAIDGTAIYKTSQFAGAEGGTYRVNNETLKTFEGKLVRFYYTVDKGDGSSASFLTSDKLEALIGTWIGELDAPIVQMATEGYIDSATVPDDEFLVTFPFDGTLSGDIFTWSWTGRNSAGSAGKSFSITTATEGKFLSSTFFPLARNLLDNNLDTEISFRYTVERPGKPRQIFRSEVAYITVGKRPVLDPAEVLEAGPLQYEILPKHLNKGATVLANFTEARATDSVTVHWQGTFNLSSAEVQAVWNPKAKNFYAIIDRDVISRGVREDGNPISVWYSFVRGQATLTSKPKLFLLKPLEYRPAPVIVDAGATESILQLYKITDKAIIRISPWNLMSEGNIVRTTLTGTFVGDVPYTETLHEEKVTADQISKGYSTSAPVANLLKLKDRSHLNIVSWVNLTGSSDDSAALLFEEGNYIVEAIAPNQSAPAFGNITGDKISVYAPDHAKKAFLSVAFAGMRAAQKITPEVIYPDGRLASIAPQNGVSTGRIDFPIDDAMLAKMVNKVMTMRYTIATSSGEMITSEVQEVTVQPLREEDLPQVLINNIAPDGTLDLNNKETGKLLANLATWPLSGKGQQVTIEIHAIGVPTLEVFDLAITSEQAINGLKDIEVLRSWLDSVPSNTQIIVKSSVILDGSDEPGHATVLRPTTYTIITVFKLNASTINLNGLSIKFPAWPRRGVESIGNSSTLTASGGVGPVTWASRKASVATVGAKGLVVGNGWGETIVDATDSAGNTASCTFVVSNIFQLAVNNNATFFPAAYAWMVTGDRLVGWDGVYDLQRVYGVRLPVNRHYWFGVTLDPGTAVFYHYQNAGVASGGRQNHLIGAWTLSNRIGR